MRESVLANENRSAPSESEQIGDELADLTQSERDDVGTRRLHDSIDADGRREVRLGDTDSGVGHLAQVDLAQPAPLGGRARRHDHRVLAELEHLVRGDLEATAPSSTTVLAVSGSRVRCVVDRGLEHERAAGSLPVDDLSEDASEPAQTGPGSASWNQPSSV